MVLGQSTHEAAQQNLTPNFMKSDADQAKNNAEGGLRDITGNSHGHDALRQDHGSIADGLKPSGERTLGESANHKVDKAGSVLQPNSTKSVGQETHDLVTPGNHSSGPSNILNKATEAVGNVFSSGNTEHK